jgi:hypothetical protein
MSDEIEDIGSNPSPRAGIAEVVAARLSRRAALRGLAGAGAAAALADQLIEDATAQIAQSQLRTAQIPMTGGPSTLTFPELHHQMAQTDAVAEVPSDSLP